jgi:hypothetical protein
MNLVFPSGTQCCGPKPEYITRDASEFACVQYRCVRCESVSRKSVGKIARKGVGVGLIITYNKK